MIRRRYFKRQEITRQTERFYRWIFGGSIRGNVGAITAWVNKRNFSG